MLKNYFKIAWRNLIRNKSYSFINILGLAIGFASAIIIGLWVYQEWSYDRHFEDSERIYRVGVNFSHVGDMAVGPNLLLDYARNFPSVEKTGTLKAVGTRDIYIGNQKFSQSKVYSADSTFFDVFSYDFIQGSRSTALGQPNSAVLTKETADKFFGSRSALDQTILLGDEKEAYTVAGVVDTKGYKSHIDANMWLNYTAPENPRWLSANTYDYVKLKKEASLQSFNQQLDQLIEHTIYPAMSGDKPPYKEWVESGWYRFIVMPITDIYLKSDLQFEPSPVGSQSNVIALFAIALLIIVIAAVNFINISTARATIRAKEVGIRKTLGTSRRALVGQFLFEAILVSSIALAFGLGLAEISLSVFKNITGLTILNGLFTHSLIQLAVISLIALAIGLMAGIYPAFYLTRFKPIKVLKGQLYGGTGNRGYFRNGLVLLQFTISICLLIGAGVIYQQLHYMRTTDLGLDRQNVFIINNAFDLGSQREAFRQKILQYPGVESASYSHRIPAGNSVWVTSARTRDMKEDQMMQTFVGDYEMIPTLGYQIIEGRNFSKDVAADTQAVLLNQSAVQALELQDPIGAELNDGRMVIGMVSDFNFESLRKNIEPALVEFKAEGSRLAIKLSDEDNKFIEKAQQTWKEFTGATPMDYYFLDQNFEKLMEKEKILAKAVLIFTILAIFISCLGLYGLSAFITEQRTKEIGIRRVLGASATQIVALLNKSFTKPILIAIVVALPAAFIFLNRWLSNFAYKTSISPWILAGAGLTALAIAFATVSWQSIRAALANPVDSLRSE